MQCGESVDLGAIEVPTFIYASKEDHIVPWKTAYASTQLLRGDTSFVLGASGHIAGVINPPAKNKRNYWTLARTAAPDAAGGQARLDADPDSRSTSLRASLAVGGQPGSTGSHHTAGRRWLPGRS